MVFAEKILVNNFLSSGSLLESNNSIGIPRIFFGSLNYHQINIFNKKFEYKFFISHGRLDKSQYLEPPSFMKKHCTLKMNISGFDFNFWS